MFKKKSQRKRFTQLMDKTSQNSRKIKTEKENELNTMFEFTQRIKKHLNKTNVPDKFKRELKNQLLTRFNYQHSNIGESKKNNFRKTLGLKNLNEFRLRPLGYIGGAVIISVLIAILLFIRPNNVRTLLANSIKKTMAVKSCHITADIKITSKERNIEETIEVDYQSPDRFRFTSVIKNEDLIMITIGLTTYVKEPAIDEWIIYQTDKHVFPLQLFYEFTTNPVEKLNSITYLKNIKQLDDEIIDCTERYYFKGKSILLN